MSIAVMNWVWTQSPTSGNERLVLLALADACSRDDGTGCWPSAATIARKANVSDRTARRVIARLEADGRVLVDRGGGRAANSYTVVMDIHSPCQTVTPDRLSGVTPGVRSGVTQLRHGSPDATVSPDPPLNPHRTAAAPARAGKTELAAGGLPGGGGAEDPSTEPSAAAARARETGPPPDARAGGGAAGEFFGALGPGWLLTAGQRSRLGPAVSEAVAAGWGPEELAAFVGANSAGVRSPYAVLAARLSPAELPAPRGPAPPRRKPWCGRCDPDTRFLLDAHGYPGDSPRRCPDCGPDPARKDPA